MATFILNMLLIAGQFWFLRGIGTRRDYMEIMMQIPSLCFSQPFLTSICISSGHDSGVLCRRACISRRRLSHQAFGVVLEIKPNVVATSGEGFVKYAARRFSKDFWPR